AAPANAAPAAGTAGAAQNPAASPDQPAALGNSASPASNAASDPGAPPEANDSSAGADGSGQQPLFSTEIEVVTVPVTVTDAAGEFVTDLNRDDFRLLDNGKEQRIEGFDLSYEPISLVVAIESSSRISGNLPEIRRAGILITQLILGESGEAAVISFDKEIKLLQGFTGDADKIEAAIKNLQPGSDDVRLTDAVSRSIAMLNQRPK